MYIDTIYKEHNNTKYSMYDMEGKEKEDIIESPLGDNIFNDESEEDKNKKEKDENNTEDTDEDGNSLAHNEKNANEDDIVKFTKEELKEYENKIRQEITTSNIEEDDDIKKIDSEISKIVDDIKKYKETSEFTDEQYIDYLKNTNKSLDDSDIDSLFEIHSAKDNYDDLKKNAKNKVITDYESQHAGYLKDKEQLKIDLENVNKEADKRVYDDLYNAIPKDDMFGVKLEDDKKAELVNYVKDNKIATEINKDPSILIKIAYLVKNGFFSDKDALKKYYSGNILNDVYQNTSSDGNINYDDYQIPNEL